MRLNINFFLLDLQFGDHCAQLEKNIALVQDRVKIEAEIDDTWADDDNDERNVNQIRWTLLTIVYVSKFRLIYFISDEPCQLPRQ